MQFKESKKKSQSEEFNSANANSNNIILLTIFLPIHDVIQKYYMDSSRVSQANAMNFKDL